MAANGDPQWMGVEINPDCQVVVKARWKGALEHGPSEVVQPLLKLLALESHTVPETTESLSMAPSLESASSFATTCKTSCQNVYMYGYGGSADRLTTKSGTLNYCYDGSTVWITRQNGGCSGSTLPTWHGLSIDAAQPVPIMVLLHPLYTETVMGIITVIQQECFPAIYPTLMASIIRSAMENLLTPTEHLIVVMDMGVTLFWV